MRNLGSSNSTTNNGMMSKVWTDGDTVIWFSRKHRGKRRKLLVTSNFFFPHNVFKRCLLLMRQNEYLWRKGVNSLPNDKILDWSKLIADDKINVTKKFKFVLGRVENVAGKQENAGNQHFFLFPQCFQRASFTGSLKVGIVW